MEQCKTCKTIKESGRKVYLKEKEENDRKNREKERRKWKEDGEGGGQGRRGKHRGRKRRLGFLKNSTCKSERAQKS